jgi:hypothetical protein
MPMEPSKLRQIHDCLDRIAKRLDQIEAQRVFDDAEDDLEELLESGETFPAPQQPFSDGAPQRIHGEPSKKDLFG